MIQAFINREINGENISIFCYKILLRTDGNIIYCEPFDYKKNDKLPARQVVKIGKRDRCLLLYVFASNTKSAIEYAKMERLQKARTGKWLFYIDILQKKSFIECV